MGWCDACGPAGPCAPDQDARERLLRAAVDIFDRKGYASASVREIVERAGITKPVLYYHFGSKEGILVAILEEGARQFQAAIAAAAAGPGTARQRLTALCEQTYGLFVQNVPVARVAHAVYYGPREGLPTFDLAVFERALVTAIRGIILDGVAAGELQPGPVEHMAAAISGVIAICTDQEISPHSPSMGLEGLHGVLNVIFDGMLARHEIQGELTQ
jgi:AcrR family transcriptional regulator